MGYFLFGLIKDKSIYKLILSHFRGGTTDPLNVDEVSEKGYQRYLATIAGFRKVT